MLASRLVRVAASATTLLTCAGAAAGCGGGGGPRPTTQVAASTPVSPVRSATPSPPVPPSDCATSLAVRATVRADVRDLLSWDFRSLAKAKARAKAETTSHFFALYDKTFVAVEQVALRTDAVSSAQVTSVSYNGGTCARPVFVVTVDQHLRNNQISHERVDRQTAKVTLAYRKGRYVVDDLGAM